MFFILPTAVPAYLSHGNSETVTNQVESSISFGFLEVTYDQFSNNRKLLGSLLRGCMEL